MNVFLLVHGLYAQVHGRKCSNTLCNNVLPFQGVGKGFVNFSKCVADLSWLYELHSLECSEGTTISGLVDLTTNNYEQVYWYENLYYVASIDQRSTSADTAAQYLVGSPPTWEIMRDMLVNFKRLMRLKYQFGFSCPDCENNMLIFDGVAFGTQKTLSDADPSRPDIGAPHVSVTSRCARARARSCCDILQC